MVRSRRPPGRTWVYDPARAFRQSKKPVPADIQHEVQHRAQELIDSTLKPRYIQPPPQKPQLPGGYLLPMAWPLLLLLFEILFSRTPCALTLL